MAIPQTPLSRRRLIGIAAGAAASLLAACGGSRTIPSALVPSATVPPSAVAGTPTPLATLTAMTTATPSAIAPSVSTAMATPSGTPTTALPPPGLDAWLHANAASFATTDPAAAVADLQPFRTIIGDARIVALGEDTHGTHEFQVMKDRLLRFLVTQMGFTLFAMEANWPETNRINDYVHDGSGDPVALLKGLYLWPWITQEVLDLIRWMRAYNDQRGSAPAVSFLGFDMQYPHVAMDDVIAYLRTVDSAAADNATALYEPFRPYQSSIGGYALADVDVRARCRANIGKVYTDLDNQKAAYGQASSPQAYARGLWAARVVMQAEELKAADSGSVRDRYMAENAGWLLDQGGPDAKIVLWAHNEHVGTVPYSGVRSMGSYMRHQYGNDMRVFGFEFGAGLFNAGGQDVAHGRFYPPGPLKAPPAPPDSYETAWQRAGEPRLVIDLRQSEGDSPAEAWVRGPHPYRTIGAAYDQSTPELYFDATRLAEKFDAVIYFAETTPSKLL